MISLDLFTAQMLEEAAERLQKELAVLSNSHINLSMSITHNSVDELQVFAPRSIKAFLPKLYDGWKVTFIESADGQIVIDLNKQIDFEI